MSINKEKKILKKQKRCQFMINKETGILCSEKPTETFIVCNAGLSTGLQQEILLSELLKCDAKVDTIRMIPGKSYCYVKCLNVMNAEHVFNKLHGISKLGQNQGVLYLSYCESLPLDNDSWHKELPPGLIILEDFINAEEESILMDCIKWDEGNIFENTNHLKHRQVKHYGYEFLYGTNNVDINKPLKQQIPNECNILWERLNSKLPNVNWKQPDQMTVNKYQPGQGIPPHVDTHSAFEDPIFSLSLGSDVVMEFRNVSDEQHNYILIPQRSFLLMTGEVRYNWIHGITPRKIDTVFKPNIGLTNINRGVRISFTFRKLRYPAICNCKYTALCDTYQNSKKEEHKQHLSTDLSLDPIKLEIENVHNIYDEIANHFSETRHTPWPKVQEFIAQFPFGSVLVDIGCGNGKYLQINEGIFKIGCDRSHGLLNVCKERQFNIFKCDCLYVPIRDGSVNGCISIAVIHHLASRERRLQAIKEMARILMIGGKALIYVWAKNQALENKKSSYLRQNKHNNRPNVDNNVGNNMCELEKQFSPQTNLPVHTNRTQFQHKDILVPWKLKNDNNQLNSETFLRYYHVFDENELEMLCNEIETIQIISSYYDQGNWCIIFQKIS